MINLTDLFSAYIEDTRKLRDETRDEDNHSFNHKYALRLSGTSYDLRQHLFEAINSDKNSQNIFVAVIYKDTECYNSARELLEIKHSYFVSYYECYTALAMSTGDVRMRSRIETELRDADIVIVLNTRDCIDVVLNMVKSNVNDVLVMIE